MVAKEHKIVKLPLFLERCLGTMRLTLLTTLCNSGYLLTSGREHVIYLSMNSTTLSSLS